MALPDDTPGMPTSASFLQEREKLPSGLRTTYETLVEAYRFHAFIHHNHPFVSYKVLASLVRDGWKRDVDASAQP